MLLQQIKVHLRLKKLLLFQQRVIKEVQPPKLPWGLLLSREVILPVNSLLRRCLLRRQRLPAATCKLSSLSLLVLLQLLLLLLQHLSQHLIQWQLVRFLPFLFLVRSGAWVTLP